MKKRIKLAWPLAVIFIIAALGFAFRPKAVPVQTAVAAIGPLQETVDEEGKTRMHDHFLLTAGVAGKLRRIALHAGDSVRAGQIVAWIDPSPIEPRQTAMLQAHLDGARASKQEADAMVGQAKAQNDQANTELERTRRLFAAGVASKEAFDRAGNLAAAAAKQLEAVESRARSAAYQVKEANAALMTQSGNEQSLPVAIKSPVEGRILRLLEQSERVVVPGAPILEIGYNPKLEIVADFLTRDAVKINQGMEAIIDNWGGDEPLTARVRMIEPGGFTKVSALGVEEQRANVVLDFLNRTENLADGYRVDVHVITWQSKSTLKVPSSAVFRSGSAWALFTVQSGKARRTIVQLGHRGAFDIEVLQGLEVGQAVIVHPSADVADGVRVNPTSTRS